MARRLPFLFLLVWLLIGASHAVAQSAADLAPCERLAAQARRPAEAGREIDSANPDLMTMFIEAVRARAG